MSWRHLLPLVVVSGVVVHGGEAMSQVQPSGERSGDVVVVRAVPRQNAVLVGEPGRPTVVNAKTIVAGTVAFATVTGGDFGRTLSDSEADDVRATSVLDSPFADEGALAMRLDELRSSSTSNGVLAANDGPGLLGGAVSSGVGDATRQVRDILSSALGRRGL